MIMYKRQLGRTAEGRSHRRSHLLLFQSAGKIYWSLGTVCYATGILHALERTSAKSRQEIDQKVTYSYLHCYQHAPSSRSRSAALP